MRQRRPVLVIGGILVCLAVAALPASAEWMADLYGGAAITQKADADSRQLGVLTTREVEFGNSFVAGGRIAYWFEALPWLGLALDGSVFKPDGNVTVVPVSLLVMLRWPLMPSDAVPAGQLQPYLAAGPSVFISETKTGLSSALPSTYSDTSIDPGLDARVGLAWQFHKRFALFGEYRFTRVKPEFESNTPSPRTTLDTTFTTHHAIAGVSFRF